jgi:hypothetical protein
MALIWHSATQRSNVLAMNAKLDPIVSEFETEEQAASYDRWFRAKVQEALDDPRPGLPHDEAMARAEALLEAKRKARAQR